MVPKVGDTVPLEAVKRSVGANRQKWEVGGDRVATYMSAV